MALYKTTSIKRVIAKVFTDLNLKEGDHRVSDMISWAGEALAKIGAFPYFETKVMGKESEPLLELVNYQAKLPSSLHRVIQVGYSLTETGAFYPMRQATGSFEHNRGLTSAESAGNAEALVELGGTGVVYLAMALYNEDYETALARINSDSSIRSLLEALLERETSGGTSSTVTEDYVYVITPGGWIKTNQETGYLMVAYQAIPLDVDGYPLVPDDESFMEALYWYINMKLMYPDWKEGKVRDAVYFDTRRSWNHYCKQAYGNAMMPDADQIESIKNTWLKLVPDIDEHTTFYSHLGERQYVHNANA
jgi:hypothetical protein